jgi:hypothetical protein
MRYLIILLLLLTACEKDGFYAPAKDYTNRSFVVYKHPKTKDFKECNIDPQKPDPFQMFDTMDECKKHYEDKGYKLFTQH